MRQFAFLSPNFAVGSDKIHYHCLIKVCPIDTVSTCSTTDLRNNPNTCTPPSYYDPRIGRRRRQAGLGSINQTDANESNMIEIVKTISTRSVSEDDCLTTMNGVCVVGKDGISSSGFTAAASGLVVLLTIFCF